MNQYTKTLLGAIFGYGIILVIILVNANVGFSGWLIGFLILTVLGSYTAHHSVLVEKEKEYKQNISTLEKTTLFVQQKAEKDVLEAISHLEEAKKNETLWKQTMLERNAGFKTLLSFIEYYEKLRDEPVSKYLAYKKNPAHRASEIVKEETKKRRLADFQNKRTQALIEMYEQYAPFLVELKDDVPDVTNDIRVLEEYNEEERSDAVVNYLTKEEYRNLPSIERNELALKRFWDRPKSNWLIGKSYERYIGYLYEQKGYKVHYFGIDERYGDMGRDLICRKDFETLIIQCKYWAQFRTIYEKHIFQLFGTAFEYKQAHPAENVKAIFYTSTQLSPLAKNISLTLGIELFENFPFDKNYPCIKCNISTQSDQKIYHLPFDPKYDDTKIDRAGEMYCSTVKEAESAGFRRAFRWQGNKV